MGRVPYPWFTFPDIHLHFFRPLSSATMYLDYLLFHPRAIWFHLHSILWYLAFVLCAAWLYWRLFPAPLALLCIVLFTLDDGHAIPAGWWSNRNALVAGAPALLALYAHLRWREAGRLAWLPLSLLGLVLGLLGGETALGICGYIAAYECCGRRGGDALSLETRRAHRVYEGWQRAVALMPALGVAMVFIVVYKWNGFGVYGSGIYLDPVAEFPQFAAHAPGRFLLLLGAQFLSLPSELPVVASAFQGPLVVGGVLTLALVVWLLRLAWPGLTPDERRHLRWLILGSAVSAIPVLATFPSGRLLLLPSFGGAAVIAVILRYWWRAGRAASWAVRACGILLAAIHLFLAPWAWPGLAVLVHDVDSRAREVLLASKLPRDAKAQVVMINGPDPLMGMYPRIMLEYLGAPVPAGWWTLLMSPHDLMLRRIGPRAIELEILDGELLTEQYEQLFRSPKDALKAGDVLSAREVAVQVLAAGDSGPTRMRFTFAPAFFEHAVFLVWKDGGFRKAQLPPVGEAMHLPRETGFFNVDFLPAAFRPFPAAHKLRNYR
ncbi:MAG: hypothetical protein HYV26_08335 [Candidatus Hydrogenedentes bacterium]|nr:hypothetical protein [Candidatus Hydrogenedentota bacterium]